jgi:hypothetical protein
MTTLKRVWTFLFLAMIAFALIQGLTTLERPGQAVILLHVKILGVMLGILSLLLFWFAFFIRNFLVRMNLKAVPLTESSAVSEFLDKIFLASILQWTLYEGIAIYGFFVANIGNRMLYGLPFLALAAFGFGLSYPKEERLVNIVKKLQRTNSKSH